MASQTCGLDQIRLGDAALKDTEQHEDKYNAKWDTKQPGDNRHAISPLNPGLKLGAVFVCGLPEERFIIGRGKLTERLRAQRSQQQEHSNDSRTRRHPHPLRPASRLR